MLRCLPALVAVVTYLLLAPEPAAAWGPATHIMLAQDALARVALLPAGLAGILTRFGVDYIYGNMAADVVLAKRLSRVKQFCHHWVTGLALFHDAETDRRRAFALGYLAHLAADTVAHGKFLPHQLMATPTSTSFGHLYWELRADQTVPDRYWRQMRRLLHQRFPEHEAALACRLDRAVLPFRANNRIFYSMNRLFSHQAWRRGTRVWHRMSRWPLNEQLLAEYRGECLERTSSVLTRLHDSPVLREDPNGTSALLHLRCTRRHLRKMSRAGVLTPPALAEAVAGHRPMVSQPADSYLSVVA